MWTNDDKFAHNVTSGIIDKGMDGKFESGRIMAGATFVHTFDVVGEYPYYSIFHPWQTGKIIVE